MSDEKNKKKGLKGAFDKIVMGAIIGGAIGSVLGMGLAPKKGKETRKALKNAAKSLVEKGRQFLEDHEQEIESIKKTSEQQHQKLIKVIRPSQGENHQNAEEQMKKIPREE